MKAQITSVKENPLLGRREVSVTVNHEEESTPSKEDVKSRIAAENNLDEDEVEVVTVKTGFGSNVSKAELKVYQEFEYDETLEEETIEEEPEDIHVDEDYEEIVAGTITEAKEALKEMEDPNYKAALKAEEDNKNRKTLKDWLEDQQ